MSEQNYNENDYSNVPASNLEDRINLSRSIEHQKRLYQLCTKLSTQQFKIFFLCEGGFSEQKIADLVKTTVKNVKAQKIRIKNKIKALNI